MELFNNLCRSCHAEKDDLFDIESSKSIKEMLEYCLQMSVSNEECRYPRSICYDCIKQLEVSYRFIKRFRLAQSKFNETFSYFRKSSKNACNEYMTKCVSTSETSNKLKQKSSGLCKNMANPLTCLKSSSKPSELVLPIEDVKPIHIPKESSLLGMDNTVSSGNIPAIICSTCSKTFFTTKAMSLHLKLSHKQKVVIGI